MSITVEIKGKRDWTFGLLTKNDFLKSIWRRCIVHNPKSSLKIILAEAQPLNDE